MSLFDDDPEDEERGKERFDEELNKFKDMLKNGSSGITNTEALEEIISYYFENEKYEDALHFVNQLLTLVPYSADSWQRKGLILHNLGRYAEAIECLDKALSLNPVDPELLISKGITLDDTGKVEEAMAFFERALEIDPTNEEALFNKGISLEKLNRYDEAIVIFRFIVDNNGEHRDGWYELGYCYDFGDRLEESLFCYTRHLELDPYNHNGWYNRGIVLNRMLRYNQAIELRDGPRHPGEISGCVVQQGKCLCQYGEASRCHRVLP